MLNLKVTFYFPQPNQVVQTNNHGQPNGSVTITT